MYSDFVGKHGMGVGKTANKLAIDRHSYCCIVCRHRSLPYTKPSPICILAVARYLTILRGLLMDDAKKGVSPLKVPISDSAPWFTAVKITQLRDEFI